MVRYMSVGAHIIQQGATEGNVAPTPTHTRKHAHVHALSLRQTHTPTARAYSNTSTHLLSVLVSDKNGDVMPLYGYTCRKSWARPFEGGAR